MRVHPFHLIGPAKMTNGTEAGGVGPEVRVGCTSVGLEAVGVLDADRECLGQRSDDGLKYGVPAGLAPSPALFSFASPS